jgi:hypothetical protein
MSTHADTDQVTATRAQLRRALRDEGLTVTGCGGEGVFDALTALAAAETAHPATVTADRLAEALDRWPHMFDGGERDMIGQIRHILITIAGQDSK